MVVPLLRPLSKKIPKYNLFAFDVETYGKENKFLMGSIIGEDFVKVFWNKEDMVSFFTEKSMFYKNARVFATNLGFDILALFSDTEHFNKLDFLLRNSSMLRVKYPKDKKCYRNIIFIDTMNFAPFSVKKMGEIMGIEKLKMPDYIKESRKPRPDEYSYIESYNVRDTKITYKFAKFLQEKINNFGARMNMTVASTSLDLFKRQYLKEVWVQEDINNIMDSYNAYYGGRTESIKRGCVGKLNYYDFNSLYPSVMVGDYPFVSSVKTLKKGNIDVIETYEGLSYVKVNAPEMNLPFLPYRKDLKLMFPIGNFDGWYTNVELRKAIELGYTITDIGKQIYYTQTHQPFKEYVLDMYKRRLEMKKDNDPTELIAKLFMNSLYGKFAQKISGREKIKNINMIKMGELKDWVSKGKVNITGDFVSYTPDKPDYIPRHILPIYSIYTSAYAKIKLWNIASKCDPFYMDTDSIITKKVLDNSNKLGELKREYVIREGVIVKPKMYGFMDYDDHPHIAVKGLPIAKSWNYNGFNSFLKEPSATFEKFTKFKESNKRNLPYNMIIDMTKMYDLEDDKRKWYDSFSIDELQESEPIVIQQKF